MYVVKINGERFEYDIHSLVKAFYPEEDVRVLTPETSEKKRAQLSEAIRMEAEMKPEGAVVFVDGTKFCWDAAAEGACETEDKKKYKNGYKRFFYKLLAQQTGRTLPWGNLTGIRPTKLAMGMLEQGKDGHEILAFLEEAHYVSREKAALSLDIAKRERKLLSGIHYQDGYSLYIGIPFCPTTCLYCSFTSYPISAYQKKTQRYIDCLIREMEYTAQVMKGRVLDTVYIGGGTPTTLEAEQLVFLLTKLKELFDFSSVQEFTVEAGRADSITPEKLKTLHSLGVNRISVNPQTMQQRTLDIIGRRHTTEQVKEAFHLAREAGFDNINMDLILGLPGEEEAEVEDTICQIRELGPDSLTVHCLAIKRASRLGKWIAENGSISMRGTDNTMRIAAEGAAAMQMKPYYLYRQKNMTGNLENVGFAREGCFGLYNILIMEEVQTIMALGAGSISKKVSHKMAGDGSESILIERCENLKEVDLYMNKIDEMIGRKKALWGDF